MSSYFVDTLLIICWHIVNNLMFFLFILIESGPFFRCPDMYPYAWRAIIRRMYLCFLMLKIILFWYLWAFFIVSENLFLWCPPGVPWVLFYRVKILVFLFVRSLFNWFFTLFFFASSLVNLLFFSSFPRALTGIKGLFYRGSIGVYFTFRPCFPLAFFRCLFFVRPCFI